jgi:LuxR family transcriptional regulator, maltose regulon positive regulatory protein
LRPPAQRDQTVPRERLLERLAPRLGIKMTLIAAPAGSGKTTMLALWCAAQAPMRPVAWVSLDERDNDPVILWVHILEAIRQACPQVDISPTPEVVGSSAIIGVVLPRLVNELAGQGDVALVLDDFHALASGVSRDSVAWLIAHAPETLQIVISSRTEPALPLAALRAHGALSEVRADELAFTAEEADVLLNGHLGLDLTSSDVSQLVRRTQGWSAGLCLAALSLQRAPDRHEFVTRFGGTNRHVIDYLAGEVLAAHDATMQDLMLRSSVLERLCGSLCDVVLDREGSAIDLLTLARTNLFLTPLDGEGEWYRFHPLFSQLLRVDLEHREPGLAPRLHARAALWFREHGLVDDAVENLLAAKDFTAASQLIGESWNRLAQTNRTDTVLSWVQRIPPDVASSDPWSQLTRAWVLALAGRREESQQAVIAVQQMSGLDRGPLPDGFASAESSLATLLAVFPPDGDLAAGIESSLRAAGLEGQQSPWRPAICLVIGRGLYLRGELEEAERWLAEAAELAPQRGRWLAAATAMAYRSLVLADAGRLDEQTLLAEQAIALALDKGIEDFDGSVFIAIGMSLAAQGRSDEARRAAERGVADAHNLNTPLHLGVALVSHAAVLRMAEDHAGAAAAIAEARTVLDACADPGVLRERLERVARLAPRHRQANRDLSDREIGVLRMLAGSLSEGEIARELYLSRNTVHTHTRSIYHKLGVSSRSNAVRKARTMGLFRGSHE